MKHAMILLIILLLICGAYVPLVRAQNQALQAEPSVELISVPERIGAYTRAGTDIDVGDSVRTYLETNRILVRRYSAPSGRPLELTIVHAAVTRRSLHFPEICLVGEGWDIREQSTMPVGVMFSAKRLVLVRGTEREAVLYWFQTGRRLTGNYFMNAWHWARDQVCFRSPVSAMVRVSTPLGSQTEDAAFSVLVDFAMKLAPLMQQYDKIQHNAAGRRAAEYTQGKHSPC